MRDEATHHEENSVNILVAFTESNPDLAWLYPCGSFANFLLPRSRFPKHPVEEQLGPLLVSKTIFEDVWGDVTQYRWSDPVAAFPFCQVSAEHGHTIGWNHTDPCTMSCLRLRHGNLNSEIKKSEYPNKKNTYLLSDQNQKTNYFNCARCFEYLHSSELTKHCLRLFTKLLGGQMSQEMILYLMPLCSREVSIMGHIYICIYTL